MRATPGILLLTMLVFLPEATAETTDVKPYPTPEQGFERMVFRVPAVADENARKVEIIVGKTLSIDCNRTSFGGQLEGRVAAGWGYPYFVLANVRGPMSTRMACPQGSGNTEAFVTVGGEGFLQRYNSKLPVVVYVPQGFEVRYRIWAAQEQVGEARPE